jgi:uncharacterized phage protein (TIGR01671 family)
MERIIKFRAFHPDWGEMIYSNLDSEWQDKREWYPICFEIGFSHYPHSIMDEKTVIMQFTGLFDKNRKEVFEEDILKCDKDIVEIVFKGGQFVGYNKNKELEIQNRNWFSWEIIGNIHQNPELLNS